MIYYLHLPVDPLGKLKMPYNIINARDTKNIHLLVFIYIITNYLGESTLFYRSRCSSISMHFYQGLPITLYYFAEDQRSKTNDLDDTKDSKLKKCRQLKLRKVILGQGGPEKGQMFHATITKNTWFARILDKTNVDTRSNTKNVQGMLNISL